MGLEVGPWIKTLKEAALRGADEDTPIQAWWKTATGLAEHSLTLYELRPALRVLPATRIAYVTALTYHPENMRRILGLAQGADTPVQGKGCAPRHPNRP